jgi:lysophospholipid acyltransferase (LPLAT)-like uncharacterized protein
MKLHITMSPIVIGKIAWWLVSLIARTIRITVHEPEGYHFRDDYDSMYVLWHGRLILPMFCYRNRNAVVLVSEHRDGDIITAALEAAGFDTVRGSTTRGGVKALARLIKITREGRQTAFTPDGPKGPRWVMQPGALFVASKTGKPIIPLGGSVNMAYYFKSWDKFQLPLPFSRGALVVGEPYHVPSDIDETGIELHRVELERRLIEVNRRADSLVGAREPK